MTQATPAFVQKDTDTGFLGRKKADLWAKYLFTEILHGTN